MSLLSMNIFYGAVISQTRWCSFISSLGSEQWIWTHNHKDDAVTESSNSQMSSQHFLKNVYAYEVYSLSVGENVFSKVRAGLSHCFCVPGRDSQSLVGIQIESNVLTAAAPFRTFVSLLLPVSCDTTGVLTLFSHLMRGLVVVDTQTVVTLTLFSLWVLQSKIPSPRHKKTPDIPLQGSTQCKVTQNTHNLHVMLMKVLDLFLSLIPECATVAVYLFIYLC